MSKTINVSVVTKSAVFPAGTVEELFVFDLLSADTVLQSISTGVTGVSFIVEGSGDFVIKVKKNGFEASASVTIAPDAEVTLLVPDTLSVEVV